MTHLQIPQRTIGRSATWLAAMARPLSDPAILSLDDAIRADASTNGRAFLAKRWADDPTPRPAQASAQLSLSL